MRQATRIHDAVDAIDSRPILGTPVAVGVAAIAISEFGGATTIEFILGFSTTSASAIHLDYGCRPHIADTAIVAVEECRLLQLVAGGRLQSGR
jgi:hypothetical protein